MGDKGAGTSTLERDWFLAYFPPSHQYFAFRSSDPDRWTGRTRITVKTFTGFDFERKADSEGAPKVFMIPKTMGASIFGLVDVETEVRIDLTGYVWWPLEDRETILEILKAWIPERMTPEEKASVKKAEEEAKARREEAKKGPSKILIPGGAQPSPSVRAKVAQELMKINRSRR